MAMLDLLILARDIGQERLRVQHRLYARYSRRLPWPMAVLVECS